MAIENKIPTEGKKTRKSPVPANFDRIMEGVKKMSLEEKVKLQNQVKLWIEDEVKAMEEKFNAAKALLNGKQ